QRAELLQIPAMDIRPLEIVIGKAQRNEVVQRRRSHQARRNGKAERDDSVAGEALENVRDVQYVRLQSEPMASDQAFRHPLRGYTIPTRVRCRHRMLIGAEPAGGQDVLESRDD